MALCHRSTPDGFLKVFFEIASRILRDFFDDAQSFRAPMKKQPPMVLPLVLASASNEKPSQAAKTTITISIVIIFVLYVVAIYLAIRDMKYLPKTSTKVWVLLLSIFCPELYVILHGISSSSQGVSFFAGSPMPGMSGGMGSSILPETLSAASAGLGLGAGPGMTSPSTLSAGSSFA
jgi:hypothetical protein